VRVAFGKKNGSASTNRLDEGSLRDAVAKAEEIAKLTPEDPEYLPPLLKQAYLRVPSFRSSTASVSPMEVARRTQPVIEQCEKNGLVAAGIMTNSVSARGVAASSGLFGYEQSTEAEFSLTATAEDSTGWAYISHRDIDALGVSDRTRTAVDKAVRSKAPREIPPGHYPVILEPAAVAGVLGMMNFSLDAKSYYKGNSALAGKLGSQVLDPRLTLRSDPANADLMGGAFDQQGLATKPMTWIENGTLKQIYYDRFTAKEQGVEPTPFPSAIVLEFNGPKAQSLDELIAGAKKAILITNFWYIRSVDPTDLTITGMTRDGTFLVEDGKIAAGVKSFRFHDSPLRCFANVDAATAPMQAGSMERGKMLLPAMRLPDFHLSSVTKF
jgi:predicted Zn-dependent protease